MSVSSCHSLPVRSLCSKGAPQGAMGSSSCGGGSSKEPTSAGSSIESSSAETPPPLVLTRESKIQLAMLLGSGTLLQLGTGMIVPCLPMYATSIGLTPADVGVVVAVPSFARALLNLPAGRVADIVGRKKPWVMGTLADGIGCVATAFAGSLNSMVAARLFMGGGSAVGSAGAGAYAMDVVSGFPQHKGRLLGMMNAANSLAWVLGPVIGGLLAERGGVGLPFVLVGGAILSMVPAVQLLLPETLPPKEGATVGSLRLRPVLKETYESFATLMRDRNQVGCALMQASLFTGWSACLSVVPLYAAATWGASPSELGTLYSVAAVLGVAGAPLGGYVADFAGRKPAVMLGSLVVSASFASLPLVETKPQLLCAMAAMGLGESFLMSANAALANDVTPRELRGAQSALLSQVGDLTFVVMPVALSLVATNVSYSAGFLTASGLILGANTGFALLATEPSRKARRGGS